MLTAVSRTLRGVRRRSTTHQESCSDSIAQQQDNAVEQQDQGLSSGLDIQVWDNSLDMEVPGIYHSTNKEYLEIEDSSADR